LQPIIDAAAPNLFIKTIVELSIEVQPAKDPAPARVMRIKGVCAVPMALDYFIQYFSGD
jgi:hypothetical protein